MAAKRFKHFPDAMHYAYYLAMLDIENDNKPGKYFIQKAGSMHSVDSWKSGPGSVEKVVGDLDARHMRTLGYSSMDFEKKLPASALKHATKIKQNPTKRKTAARTQRAAESYVRRPSQITKRAPSKRLKKRRTVNLQSPRGVFPNPKTRSSLEKTSSWVIRNKKTGEVIMETFDIKKVNALNTAKYEAVPILKYLQELNSGIKKNPSSVHFDIDVNSHNARGAKAKTRTNPVAREKITGLKNFIVMESAFSDTTGFKTVAVFAKVDESFEYAKARDAKNRAEGKRRWIKVLEG